jgi:biopolymer transport protein ExbD
MSGKHRRAEAEPVQPDLPITPMLDMSFQLMAFFIFTFRPAPTEGQIAMSLPKEDGGPADAVPSITDDKPVAFLVKVDAAPTGSIASMTLQATGVDAAAPEPLGADTKKYQEELKKRWDALKGKPAKLTLEIGDGLVQEYVVSLLDIAVNVGFTDIAPVPMDPKKR